VKLKTIILENFRCYKDETRIEIGDLTAFIGKNDIGKSSILEALEIFFNNGLIKIEKLDACVYRKDKSVRIGCIFTDLPKEIVLDVSATTNLKDEHLLNQDGFLEIYNLYDCGGSKIKEQVYARAQHPTEENAQNLLLMKNAELKEQLEKLNIGKERVDLRSNPSIRKAIWSSCENLKIRPVDIPLNKEEGDAKKIWDRLQEDIPTFALFKADRPSRDDDAEVQDPMKLAVDEAVKLVKKELERIKEIVKEKATEVAQRTLEKLKEMNPSLAKELSPNFKAEPKWNSLFKLTLTGDNQIPINKRGSGTRRLILINFFRADAERRQKISNTPSIIYAIEEPETSQHPSNQKMLMEALAELSEQDNCQVILTTHVPGLAGLLSMESLRYVYMGKDEQVCIGSGNEKVYKKIANELGVLPDHRIKVFVCIEGPNDISFLKQISELFHKNDVSIPNLSDNPQVALLPLSGSNLIEWVQNHYLRELGRPEVHIYDGDKSEYQDVCNKIKARNDNSCCFRTRKKEIENYLHPEVIKKVLGVSVTFGPNDDVPALVAKAIHESDSSSKPWAELKEEERRGKIKRAKKRLNNEVASKMTIAYLEQSDPNKEIEGWLREITKKLS